MTMDNLKTYSKIIEIDFLAAAQNDYLGFTDHVLAMVKKASFDICKTATGEGLVQAWNPKKVFVDLSGAIYENINLGRFSSGLGEYFRDPFSNSEPVATEFTLFTLFSDREIRVTIQYPPREYRHNELPSPAMLERPLRMLLDEHCSHNPIIKKVIFNPPATVVYWSDGSKTVSKVQKGDTWDSEKGLAMAIIKKTMGLKEFNKHIDEHAVNADFWHYATSEVLAKKSVDELGFKPHMDAIVSRYGTDLVKKYLKSVEENGMDIKGE